VEDMDETTSNRSGAMKSFSGLIAGYDPGGDHKHGLAILTIESGACKAVKTFGPESARRSKSGAALHSVRDVLTALNEVGPIAAIGVDTLARWSTSQGGWRQADKLLRNDYGAGEGGKGVALSVTAPNSLYGSMSLNGMMVLLELRKKWPSIHITETHPKVLYYAKTNKKYDYPVTRLEMDERLSKWLGHPEGFVATKNDHEWDAVVSAYAAWMGFSGQWKRDLFQNPESADLVSPAGQDVHYWWPEQLPKHA
jgi:hypothetical protein